MNFFALVLLLLLSISAFGQDQFPYRSKYPHLTVISTNELKKEYDQVLVIDVRSKFEFDVMRIRDAKHVPMSNVEFLPKLETVRKKDDARKLVFYCNGRTCEKSYEAGNAASKAGFKNLAVYDAGVFDWINANADLGSFFGQSPVDLSKVIDAKGLKAKMLPWDKFKAGAEKSGNLLVDVRDPVQRKKTPAAKDIRSIQLDKLVVLLKEKKLDGKELYFMDAVGKQVQWLQYHLENNGYKNYHFLDGGVDGLKL